MNLKREQEFVSQYHFDARNFEWENENGAPETKVDVNFQLLQHDQENCLLYTSPSPRDPKTSRMPSSA